MLSLCSYPLMTSLALYLIELPALIFFLKTHLHAIAFLFGGSLKTPCRVLLKRSVLFINSFLPLSMLSTSHCIPVASWFVRVILYLSHKHRVPFREQARPCRPPQHVC